MAPLVFSFNELEGKMINPQKRAAQSCIKMNPTLNAPTPIKVNPEVHLEESQSIHSSYQPSMKHNFED